jgi:hypothetical protein
MDEFLIDKIQLKSEHIDISQSENLTASSDPCIFEAEFTPILDQNYSEYQSVIDMIDRDSALLNDTFRTIQAKVPLLYTDLVTSFEAANEIDIFHKNVTSYLKQQEISKKISQTTQIFDRLNAFELEKSMHELEDIRDSIGLVRDSIGLKADFNF